jgi:hypothetical protein
LGRFHRFWSSFIALTRYFRKGKIGYLLEETSRLHDHVISGFARIDGELGRLHSHAIPEIEHLGTELAGLHSDVVSGFARIDGELGKLHSQAIPEIEYLSTELAGLHSHVVSGFAAIDAELGKLNSQTVSEIARLGEQVGNNQNDSAQQIDRLRDEQSRLHSLVTGRLTTQLEYLNREIYGLKKDLYHPHSTPPENAFNGQFSKHRIFDDLCAAFPFQAFVETGAYLGSTTQFLCRQGKPVYAVEIDPGSYERTRTRLRNEQQVQLALGESPEFLETLTRETLAGEDLTFFYLDAHWREHLPLREELNVIATRHPRAVVMIDDFKIEDDRGYGYDSYDGGQEIALAFLDDELRKHAWQVFFPALLSSRDHMITDILPPRGTAVMSCDEEIARVLRQILSLRHWP